MSSGSFAVDNEQYYHTQESGERLNTQDFHLMKSKSGPAGTKKLHQKTRGGQQAAVTIDQYMLTMGQQSLGSAEGLCPQLNNQNFYNAP